MYHRRHYSMLQISRVKALSDIPVEHNLHCIYIIAAGSLKLLKLKLFVMPISKNKKQKQKQKKQTY